MNGFIWLICPHRFDEQIYWPIQEGSIEFDNEFGDLKHLDWSKLADWFRPGTTRMMPADKGGNYFLDRDSKTFRHIMAYLRFKKEKCVTSLGLWANFTTNWHFHPPFRPSLKTRWIGQIGGRMWSFEFGGATGDGPWNATEISTNRGTTLCREGFGLIGSIQWVYRWQVMFKWACAILMLGNSKRSK